MIFIKSLHVENFKGIERLTCDFEDLTLLAGLNNSGKTSVLQAMYLIVSTLKMLRSHPHIFNENRENRGIDLNSPIGKLGLPNFEWLLRGSADEFSMSATFWNGCTVKVEMFRRGQFCFDVSAKAVPEDEMRSKLQEMESLTAEFFRPPGMLPARELMLNGDQYRNVVAAGQGNVHWRNSIWWGIQNGGGPASFEPVRELVSQHFPGVDIRHPRLGSEGQPPIIIEYQEPGHPIRDIAQSGAGLHTFLSLAQVIKQSEAGLVLLDEPDSHLHSSQQALVVELWLAAINLQH